MASTLVRAIVTGFGLKLGSEIAKVFSQKVSDLRRDPADPRTTKPEEEDEDDMPPTTSADPPSFDADN